MVSLVFPQGASSITREIRREFSFFNETDTFLIFVIDLLSVLNESNRRVLFVTAQSSGYLVLHDLCYEVANYFPN